MVGRIKEKNQMEKKKAGLKDKKYENIDGWLDG